MLLYDVSTNDTPRRSVDYSPSCFLISIKPHYNRKSDDSRESERARRKIGLPTRERESVSPLVTKFIFRIPRVLIVRNYAVRLAHDMVG